MFVYGPIGPIGRIRPIGPMERGLFGNRDSLRLGLIAEGAADSVIERLVGLGRILLLLLLDVLAALQAQRRDFFLDRLALGRLFLDVFLALLGLHFSHL